MVPTFRSENLTGSYVRSSEHHCEMCLSRIIYRLLVARRYWGGVGRVQDIFSVFFKFEFLALSSTDF